MAVQKGIYNFTGRLGNVVGRTGPSQGQYILSEFTDKVDAQRIANDPNFVRTRENNVEFGGAAYVSKDFQRTFQDVSSIRSKNTFQRFLRIAMSIRLLDNINPRGKRSYNLNDTIALQEVIGFQLNKNHNFDQTNTISFVFNLTPTTFTFSYSSFDASSQVFPGQPGATHFRLFSLVGTMSNYIYNAPTKNYKAVDGVNDGNSIIGYSPYIDVTNPSVPADVVSSGAITPATPGATYGFVGIIFYQLVGGIFYRLYLDDAGVLQASI